MKYLVILSVVITVLCGCHSVAVQTDHDDYAELVGLKTYRWLQTDTPPGEDIRVNNPQVINSVKGAVDDNLSQKGYQKIDKGPVDFLVTWFGAIKNKVKVDSIAKFYNTYGYGAVIGSTGVAGTEGNDVLQFKEGTIIIDFLNPTTREILWRRTGTKRILQESNEGDADLYINDVVTQMLKSLPKAKN